MLRCIEYTCIRSGLPAFRPSGFTALTVCGQRTRSSHPREDEMKALGKIIVFASALAWPALAYSQGYPEKPVTVVIPQSPGSSSDILGRYVAEGLAKLWGKAVVIENAPGAGTMLGTGHVAMASPDGYTLLFQSSQLSGATAVAEDLPFEVTEALQPVAVVATGDMVILTGTRTPMPTLADVAAKAKETKLFHASSGAGSTGEMVLEVFSDEAGINMEAVRYKSPPEALIDLVGGRVDLFSTSVTTYLSSAAVGKSTPVAVASSERSTALPEVPTAIEAGFPGVVVEPWWGLFAPTGTSPEILAKINADVTTLMKQPESVAFLAKSHNTPEDMSIEEATDFVFGDIDRARKLIKDRGLY
jgi:tripartite-type tricarboxylate transporter receptor subunit TctC